MSKKSQYIDCPIEYNGRIFKDADEFIFESGLYDEAIIDGCLIPSRADEIEASPEYKRMWRTGQIKNVQ